MKNLVWQFHINLNREKYDGGMRRQMTYCSMATASLYAAKHGAEYELCTNSTWHASGVRGGPAMDRFQLMEPRYDSYDYILYLDTDILLHPKATNLFGAIPEGTDIAADNWLHKYDRELLETGWLSQITDKEDYKKSAIQGGIILMSREFRQWFRENCDPKEISCDIGKKWPADKDTIKWPVYDQSLMSYYIHKSPFSLFNINTKEILNRNQIIHLHGQKSTEQSLTYYEKFSEIISAWACDLSVTTVTQAARAEQ
jgi:hypothetical protein